MRTVEVQLLAQRTMAWDTSVHVYLHMILVKLGMGMILIVNIECVRILDLTWIIPVALTLVVSIWTFRTAFVVSARTALRALL
tara:strand:+ start:196 stop:444 length:249 start_codon:yes stop_codon:yes gene_type:complete